MKKLLILSVMIMVASSLKAQIPTPLVFDPKAVAQATKNGVILQKLTNETKQLAKAKRLYEQLRKSANWVQKLRSVKMAIDLLEQTVCTSQNLEISLRQAGMVDNCLFQFEHYNALMGLASATDMLNMVLSNMDQTPESRINNASRAMEIMAEAHRKLSELTSKAESKVARLESQRAYKKEVKKYMSLRWNQ